MKADHYRCVGFGHPFCQDFSTAKASENRAFAVVSDGCSTANDSEIGAMLIVKSAETYLLKNPKIESVNHIYEIANIHRRSIGLPEQSLRATLLMANAEHDCFSTLTSGDGMVIARHITDGLRLIHMEYESGAPFYYSYVTQNSQEAYLKEFDGKFIVQDKDFRTENLSHESIVWRSFEYDQYDLVAVLSDGINSFVDENHQPIPKEIIIEELFAFKNYAGEFVKRRCYKAFENFKAKGWTHGDDFSIGAICL